MLQVNELKHLGSHELTFLDSKVLR